MKESRVNDAKKLSKKMKKLINDAKSCGLQFVMIDDSIRIGDIEIDADWDTLIGDHKVDEFMIVGETIQGIGA